MILQKIYLQVLNTIKIFIVLKKRFFFFLKKIQKFLRKLDTTFILKKIISNFWLQKFVITLFYFVPFFTLSLNTHLSIRKRYPNFVPNIIPFGSKLIYNSFLINTILTSPLPFIYYYITGDIVLSPQFRYLGISRRIKFAFLMSNVLEFMYSTIIQYIDFFTFTSTIVGIKGRFTNDIALIHMTLFCMWYFFYVVFYILSINGKYPIIPKYSFLYFPRKIINSVLFWIQIVPKYKKKKD